MKKAIRIILFILLALLIVVAGYVAYVFISYHRIGDQTLTVELGAPGTQTKTLMSIERWAVRNVNQLSVANDSETLI